MRVLVVGASGTIGQAVVRALAMGNEDVRASRSRSEVKVDITEPDSIRRMYRNVGRVDAVVAAAGEGKFGPLEVLTDEDFRFTLGSKLMGQINLVRLSLIHISEPTRPY